MPGYVYIRSGAIHTPHPERYPARQNQIDNLRAAFGLGEDEEAPIFIEKAKEVTDLRSLPKLFTLLFHAKADSDRVYIDDFRRIFLACPIEKRKDLIAQLAGVGSIFWELRGGERPFTSLKRDDLAELLFARGRVDFTLVPKKIDPRNSNARRKQTARARSVSAYKRSKNANAVAAKLATLREELLETGMRTTLKAIADEANRRTLTTSRGNPWTAASVHRALKRIE